MKIKLIPLGLAVLGLGACSAPRILPNLDRSTDIQSLYTYGVADRDLRLTVRGNPFAVPQEAFDRVVEQAVDGGGMLQPPPKPRIHPDASAAPNYQMVLVFQPAPTLDGQGACDGQPGGGGQAANEVKVVAAFCVAGKAVSQTTGWVGAASVDDPALRSLLNKIDGELFRPDEALQGSGASSSR